MFDPNADPLADPVFAAAVFEKLLRGADHPWELDAPPGFDFIEESGRFLRLAQQVNAIVGDACEIELWPTLRDVTFHGELVLPPAALTGDGAAVLRVSNFANLTAILDDETNVKPEVFSQIKRRLERNGYRFIPAAPLRRPYDGHHRGTKQFDRWRDRLFGYLRP
jgi:hypothetical protein